jgi:hypothetical protein
MSRNIRCPKDKPLISPATPNSERKTENISATIEFPKTLSIIGNLAVAVWIALDTVTFWLIDLTVGVAFLIAALIAIYGVLKFLGCLRPCFNCKKCTFGMGRIAALYFGKRSLKDYKETYRFPTALFFYVFLGPFPAISLLVSTIYIFDVAKLVILVCLLALTVYSGLTWRQTSQT